MNRITHLDDERQYGHGWILTLKPGWSFYETQHEGVMGFDTKREALKAAKQSYPCACTECSVSQAAE